MTDRLHFDSACAFNDAVACAPILENEPLVSVIIPTYNRADTLRRAIASALVQTYTAREIIVVDDGSTDETESVVRTFGSSVRFFRQANAGPSAARNTGIAVAHGEIVAFLDSDDEWLPRKLQRQVGALLRADVSCCVCNASLRHGGREFAQSFPLALIPLTRGDACLLNPAEILATRFLLFNQVVAVRRDALLKVGGFRPELRLLEDYDLAFRLALLGPWALVGEPLVVKNEETDGIGVTANRNHWVRASSFKRVIEGFLREDLSGAKNVRRLLVRVLRDVNTELRATERLSRHAPLPVLCGRAAMFALRLSQAMRRRLPGWPKARLARLPLAMRSKPAAPLPAPISMV